MFVDVCVCVSEFMTFKTAGTQLHCCVKKCIHAADFTPPCIPPVQDLQQLWQSYGKGHGDGKRVKFLRNLNGVERTGEEGDTQ